MTGLAIRLRAAVLGTLCAGLLVLPAGLPPAAGDPAAAARAAGAAGSVEAATSPPEGGEPPLPVLDIDRTPAFDQAAVGAAVSGLLADPALGTDPGMVVLDAGDAALLTGSSQSEPRTPASSLKIVTGTSALAALGPQRRLTTTVERDTDGALVLIGGGDPTLVTEPSAGPRYPQPASLADLAEQTAAALRTLGVSEAGLRFDAGLFSGPALHPDWDPTFVAQGIVSPVSALKLDPASPGVDAAALDADPAAATAAWFAARLIALGIRVPTVGPGSATAQASVIASVESPPIVGLVDRMLDISDNDVAEALFRLAALGRGLPGSFEGGVRAVSAALEELDVPRAGLVIRDGSGLSRNNRISASTLANILVVEAEDPAVESTWLPSGLPVGGLTGTLADRFSDPTTSAGAGRVHAKTGNLTGVTSLTGLVTTAQGRPLAFAVLANGTTDTLAARHALDRIAAALAACGCRASAT